MQKQFTAIIERCTATELYVGYIPGLVGAHSQGESMEELIENLQEVLAMLVEEGMLVHESEFITTQQFIVES